MFDSHKLNENGFSEMRQYKHAMASAVGHVLNLMADGRDKSIFITKLEEAVFFSAKAISSKEGNFTEITSYPVKD